MTAPGSFRPPIEELASKAYHRAVEAATNGRFDRQDVNPLLKEELVTAGYKADEFFDYAIERAVRQTDQLHTRAAMEQPSLPFIGHKELLSGVWALGGRQRVVIGKAVKPEAYEHLQIVTENAAHAMTAAAAEQRRVLDVILLMPNDTTPIEKVV